MNNDIKCSMQHSIEKAEARKYRNMTIAKVEEMAANIRGIGFPFSGDALRLAEAES